MKKSTLIAIIILALGIAGIYGFKALLPLLKQQRALSTSDAKDLQGEVTIALDSWIGYFPLQSPVFRQLMREAGYKVNIQDDNADYATRMSRLTEGKIDFAVVTVDSYLLNGAREDFPGTIIFVIDESRGGDALVGWKTKVSNLDTLKTLTDFRLAFTPDSPSEHLLKAIGFHFGVSELLNKQGRWRVPTTGGAEEAYKKLMKQDVDMAAIWEPYVSQALQEPGIVKLLGTEDTSKLIIDILVVNRDFSRKQPELVAMLVENFFKTQAVYAADPGLLHKDIALLTRQKEDSIQAMLRGVRWLDFSENTRWFGLVQDNVYYQAELLLSIESTLRILTENGDLSGNPLPNSDPYTIVNSSYLEKLYVSNAFSTQADSSDADSLEKDFSTLTPAQWDKLEVIGTLKLYPISFRSGTAELDTGGENQLDEIVESIRHYPNFRILIKGHTGVRGDVAANLALSRERAGEVKQYLHRIYNIDEDRMLALGLGGTQPLTEEAGESERAYDVRLKRVEIYLVH